MQFNIKYIVNIRYAIIKNYNNQKSIKMLYSTWN